MDLILFLKNGNYYGTEYWISFAGTSSIIIANIWWMLLSGEVFRNEYGYYCLWMKKIVGKQRGNRNNKLIQRNWSSWALLYYTNLEIWVGKKKNMENFVQIYESHVIIIRCHPLRCQSICFGLVTLRDGIMSMRNVHCIHKIYFRLCDWNLDENAKFPLPWNLFVLSFSDHIWIRSNWVQMVEPTGRKNRKKKNLILENRIILNQQKLLFEKLAK